LRGICSFARTKISSFPFAAVSRGATVTAPSPQFARFGGIPPHRKEDRRMLIPQRGIALASPCAHGGRIVRLEPGQLSGRLSCKSRAHHFAQSPPFGPAHEAQGRVRFLGSFFSVNADLRRWQPVPSVATDCDVDLRVALPFIYPYR